MSDFFPTRTLEVVAEERGCPGAAVDLVESITEDMAWHAGNVGMAEMPHLNATGFCNLFRRRVLSEFGKSSASVLKGWGLYGSHELGRIVFALVAADRLDASPEDSLEDFVGLFTVDEYFA